MSTSRSSRSRWFLQSRWRAAVTRFGAVASVCLVALACSSSNSPAESNGGSAGTGGAGFGESGGASGSTSGTGAGGSSGLCNAGAPLTVTSNPTPDTTVGAAYDYSYQATGGCLPYTWTVTGGSLPPGLTMSSSGTISGAATTVGNYTFTVQCCDSVRST